MRPTIQRAANIREIRAVEGSKMLFEDIAPLLNVTFVRNGQLTVIPFPFKYLRESISFKNMGLTNSWIQYNTSSCTNKRISYHSRVYGSVFLKWLDILRQD